MKPLDRRAGFVQIFVIGGLLAIAGVLTLITGVARLGVKSSAALERLVIGGIVTDTAFAQLSENVAQGATDFGHLPPILSGQPTSMVIENEGGKIALLAAPLDIVRAYASNAGLKSVDISALLSGLEAARSRHDGQQAILETEFALGKVVSSQQIYADFSPYSQVATIDPASASPEVLSAIPDLSTSERDQIRSAREDGLPIPAGLSDYLGGPQTMFSMVVTVDWSETEHLVRRVPFDITGDGQVRQIAAGRT